MRPGATDAMFPAFLVRFESFFFSALSEDGVISSLSFYLFVLFSLFVLTVCLYVLVDVRAFVLVLYVCVHVSIFHVI